MKSPVMPEKQAPSPRSGTTPLSEDWNTRLDRLLKANPKLTSVQMGLERDKWEAEWEASLPPPLSSNRVWRD